MAEMRNSLTVTGDASAIVNMARQMVAALDQVSSAATKTETSYRNVLARTPTADWQQLSATVKASATSIMSAQQSVNGFTKSVASSVSEMRIAHEETAVWGAHLSGLRAQFDPLYAASRRYEAELDAIADAERLGALSATQAASARERASALITAGSDQVSTATRRMFASVGGGGMVMKNLAFQLNQIGQQGAVTGNYLGALSIQLPDILASFGFLGVLIGGVSAVAAPMAIELFRGADAGKKLADVVAELTQNSNAVGTALSEARKSVFDLREEFGPAAEHARALNMALLDIAQLRAESSLRESLDKIGSSISDLASFGVTNISTLQDKFNLTEHGAGRVAAAMQKFSAAITIDEQTAAAEQLVEAFRKAEYGVGGASQKALDFAANAGTAAVEALRIAGYSEQAAKLQDQLAKGNISAPYTSAADEAKRLADETARILKDTGSARKMRTEMEAQAQINAAIVAYGRDSVEVKRLQIDAARAEYAESLKTLKVNDDIKQALMDQWELTNGLKSADPFGMAAAARSILETQSQSLAKLQLEQALLGQNEETRRRVLALYQAELEIRQKGIAPSSALAEQIRQGALAEAELTAAVKRQVGAWEEVSGAAETAIDKLLGGDFKGALEGIATELEKLAIVNPLKNALLGTDYATLGDAGGFQGIWDRLMGKTPAIDPAKAAATAAAQAVSTMQVTAANVIIGGAGVAQLVGASSANYNGAPMQLAGSTDVQSQIWQFFSGKGLAPHQVAAIMGNVAGESGFNPLAMGDNGTSYGLFQHHASRADGLLSALGGKSGLGNVQGQLDYVWQELLGSQSGALAALKAAPDVGSATDAWMRQFERPSAAAMTESFPQRMAAAEAAMAKFSTTTTSAQANLGQLGSGFDLFGSSLAGAAQGLASGGAQGGLSGFLGTLAGGLAHAWGIPGFASGGETGGSDPSRVAGVVHEAEYVFDAAATRRIGVRNLDALRRGTLKGYASGGYVSHAADYPYLRSGSARPEGGGNVIQLQPVLINNSSTPMRMEVQEVTDSRGQRQQRYVLSDAVAEGVMAPGGKASRSLRQAYGLNKSGINR